MPLKKKSAEGQTDPKQKGLGTLGPSPCWGGADSVENNKWMFYTRSICLIAVLFPTPSRIGPKQPSQMCCRSVWPKFVPYPLQNLLDKTARWFDTVFRTPTCFYLMVPYFSKFLEIWRCISNGVHLQQTIEAIIQINHSYHKKSIHPNSWTNIYAFDG